MNKIQLMINDSQQILLLLCYYYDCNTINNEYYINYNITINVIIS